MQEHNLIRVNNRRNASARASLPVKNLSNARYRKFVLPVLPSSKLVQDITAMLKRAGHPTEMVHPYHKSS